MITYFVLDQCISLYYGRLQWNGINIPMDLDAVRWYREFQSVCETLDQTVRIGRVWGSYLRVNRK